MRPVVAVFISGFKIGFAITDVNPSIHRGLRYRCAHLQRGEHKHYHRGE
jgi:hypothetical protein